MGFVRMNVSSVSFVATVFKKCQRGPGRNALRGDRTGHLEVRSPKSTCIDLYRVATLKFNGKIGTLFHCFLWEPIKKGPDYPVKFKGGNAVQVDTGRLRTSNREVLGSIPDSSIFGFRFKSSCHNKI